MFRILIVSLFVVSGVFAVEKSSAKGDAVNIKAMAGRVSSDTKTIRSRAFRFMLKSQNPNGSYGNRKFRVTKTALVVYAFASSQRKYIEIDGPFMSNAVDYILSKRNRNGSFGKDDPLAATAWTVEALRILDAKKYADVIKSAEVWLNKNMKSLGGYKESNELRVALLGSHKSLKQKDAYSARFLKVMRLLGSTKKEARIGVADSIKEFKKLQNANDQSPDYGAFAVVQRRGYESDVIVVTALTATCADRIRANFGKFIKQTASRR